MPLVYCQAWVSVHCATKLCFLIRQRCSRRRTTFLIIPLVSLCLTTLTIISTLDGLNTFHVMKGIKCISPKVPWVFFMEQERANLSDRSPSQSNTPLSAAIRNTLKKERLGAKSGFRSTNSWPMFFLVGLNGWRPFHRLSRCPMLIKFLFSIFKQKARVNWNLSRCQTLTISQPNTVSAPWPLPYDLRVLWEYGKSSNIKIRWWNGFLETIFWNWT